MTTFYNLEKIITVRPDQDVINELIKDPDFFSTSSHKSEQQHAKKIDKILGIKTARIESYLLKNYRSFHKSDDQNSRKKRLANTQTWIGLDTQVLLTPYSQISQFFSVLQKHSPEKIVDLGAAYGRVGLVMNAFFPEAKFTGYEIVEERVKEANRIFENYGLSNCEVHQQNILDEDFHLPTADIYFIYDFSDPADIRTILKKISEIIFIEKFFIVAKGDGIRSIISKQFPEFSARYGVIHQEYCSIYSSFCDF